MRRVLLFVCLTALAVTSLPLEVAAEEDKIKFWGDIRGRWEGFWFSQDETGSEKDHRTRLRYRLRFNVRGTINDHTYVEVRFGTGGTDSRTANQTIGSPEDFGPNTWDVRRAFLAWTPYANGGLPNREGAWVFEFGRIANPFLWKRGKDMMLWDGDINPGGVATKFNMGLGTAATIFASLGAFAIDENSSGTDPYLVALQGGLEYDFSDAVESGLRGTFYYFDNLDSAFVKRGVDPDEGVTASTGNIPDGLTGSAAGGTMRVIEVGAFVKATSLPVTAFGGFSDNLTAEPSKLFPGVGKESVAYNVGLEVGDKKKNVKVGGAYFYVEANAFPSMYIDSDMLDGVTNKFGFLLYGSRQVVSGVDFNIQSFLSDAIETETAFASSVTNSERTRLQIDIVYKF